MAEISAFDSRAFWGGLYLTPILWVFLLIVGILRLKFEYLPIIICAISLSMANIVGYTKCSSSATNKIHGLAQGAASGLTSALASSDNSTLRSWVLSSLLAITTAAPSAAGAGAARNGSNNV
jgi:hypothetical protein